MFQYSFPNAGLQSFVKDIDGLTLLWPRSYTKAQILHQFVQIVVIVVTLDVATHEIRDKGGLHMLYEEQVGLFPRGYVPEIAG